MLDNTLAQILGVDPNATTGNLAMSLIRGQNNQSVSNAQTPAMPNLSLGGGAPNLAGSAYQAPQASAPVAPVAPQPQIGPTIAAANGQQPQNPLNQARPVAPQMMPVSMPQGGSAPAAAPAAPAQAIPIPNFVPQQGGTTWNDYSNPATLPQAQAPAQPVAPQPSAQAQPTAPGQTVNNVTPQDLMGDQIFNSMLHTESGNQNFNPDGTPVTSSAGAKYAAQVMPATAKNPGFGVRPAQNDSPEEYNRVGKEYHEAMRRRYGDEEKAVAAYNAGPGGVDHAVALATQAGNPDDWKKYLPAETQQYLSKVNPAATIAKFDQNQPVAQKVGYQTTGNDDHDALIAAGNDPTKLSQLAFSDKYSPEIRQAASQSLYDLMSHQQGMAAVKQQFAQSAANGDTLNIDRQARQNTPEGSRFRAMLYELAGAKTAAQNEYNKLGVGATWTQGMSPEGKPMTIYQGPDGRAIRAIDPSTGEEITDQKTLQTLNGGGMAGAKAGGANMQYTAADGTTHVINEMTMPNGLKRYFDATDRKWLTSLPPNVRHVGQEDPLEKAARTQADRERGRLENQNIIARGQGAPEPFSRQEIERRVNSVYTGVKGGKIAPAPEAVEPTAPGAAPAAPATPAAANAPAAPTNAVGPDIEAQAQAIYRGEQKMPTGLGANNYRNRAVVNRVNQIAQEQNKPYDPTVYDQRMDTEKKFNTGQQGNTVRSMNVAIDHMDSLRDQIKKLPTGQYPAVNEIITNFSKNIGDPRINSYDAMAGLIAAEVTKAVVANGGTGNEREEKEKLLAVQNNPEALRGVLDSYTKLLGGQMHGLKTQYEAGHGNSWDAKVSPRTSQAMAESKANRAWNDQDKQAAQWLKANPNDPRANKIKQRLGLD